VGVAVTIYLLAGRVAGFPEAPTKAHASVQHVLWCCVRTPPDLRFWLGIACCVCTIAIGVMWLTLLILGVA
jgi:hypothetical protein